MAATAIQQALVNAGLIPAEVFSTNKEKGRIVAVQIKKVQPKNEQSPISYKIVKELGLCNFKIVNLAEPTPQVLAVDKTKFYLRTARTTGKGWVNITIFGSKNQLNQIVSGEMILARAKIVEKTVAIDDKKVIYHNIDLYLHRGRGKSNGEIKVCQNEPKDASLFKRVFEPAQGGSIIVAKPLLSKKQN